MDVLPYADAPDGDARRLHPKPLPGNHEALEVGHQPVEEGLAPDAMEGLRVSAVQGDPVLVQAAQGQGLLPSRGEQGAVGVEEDRDPSLPEVADHVGQLAVDQGLADAVQHGPLHLGELGHQGLELLQGQVSGLLVGVEGAGAGLTQQVAAVGHLDEDAARWRGGNRTPLLPFRQAVGGGQILQPLPVGQAVGLRQRHVIGHGTSPPRSRPGADPPCGTRYGGARRASAWC